MPNRYGLLMRLLSAVAGWLFLLVTSASAQNETTGMTLNVLTFNLRYNNPGDGYNAWPKRKELAAKVLTDQQADFVGMQEALSGMIGDLQDLLPGYAWTGVGRDDGQSKGEFAPIFYRKDRFTLEKHGVFWLSETPEVAGSKSWDAALPRIATWGVFRELQGGRKVFVVNTHFDHRGEEARRQSAKLLIGKIGELSQKLPVVLTGDFNTGPDSPAIKTLTEDERLKLTDSKAVTQTAHTGGECSFNDFGQTGNEGIIDFIFVGPGIEVKSHGFLKIVAGDLYVSDHWPVVSRVVAR